MWRASDRKHEAISIDDIEDDGKRLRKRINEDTVVSLMSTMGEKSIGLQTPIVVKHYPNRPNQAGDTDDSIVLVIGGHRLEAARRLGWTHIDAFMYREGENDRELRLWEIAENLDRAQLTHLERKEHIAEWVRLTEEQDNGILSQLAKEMPKPRKRGQPEGGVAKASRVLGIDKDEAYRSTAVAGMAPEAKEVARDLKLDDNQSALLRAATQPTAELQIARLRREAERVKNAKEDREAKKVITAAVNREFAEWLMGSIGLHEFSRIVDWLQGCKPSGVIDELRSMTADPPAIMDQRYGDAA